MKNLLYLLVGCGLLLGLSAPARAQEVPALPGTSLTAAQVLDVQRLAIEKFAARGFLLDRDVRAPGDDDATALDKAVAAMQHLHAPLHLTGAYAPARTVVVGGGYVQFIGEGASFDGRNEAAGRIDGPTAPDLRYPTATDPGPLRGACFYFTSTVYYSKFSGLTFQGFRYALAFLEAHNSPTFNECEFLYCNVGIMCYQGSQNYNLLNCRGAALGVAFVGSATCFPLGSPYAGSDNYYTDSFRWQNVGGYGSFTTQVQPAFDQFFVASILRPGVGSCPGGRKNVLYADGSGRPYGDRSFYAQPTGRVVFLPFRNGRGCNTLTFDNIDVRGPSPRGLALINTEVTQLYLGGVAWERVDDRQPAGVAVFQFGSIKAGQYNPALVNDNATSPGHPLLELISGPAHLTVPGATTPNRPAVVGRVAGRAVPPAPAAAAPAARALRLGLGAANSSVDHGSGALVANPEWRATDFVPVVPGRAYVASLGVFHAAYYDRARRYLAPWGPAPTDRSVAPAGAAYVRLSVQAPAYAGLALSPAP